MRNQSQKVPEVVETKAVSLTYKQFKAYFGTGHEVTFLVATLVFIFMLSFMLSGCGVALNGSPTTEGRPILQLTAQGDVPTERVASDLTGPPAAQAPASPPVVSQEQTALQVAFLRYIRSEAVVERVRIVLGWLEFTSQTRSAAEIRSAWERLKQNDGALDRTSSEVAEKMVEAMVESSSPMIKVNDNTLLEFKLWCQLLKIKTRTSQTDALVFLYSQAERPGDLDSSDKNLAALSGTTVL